MAGAYETWFKSPGIGPNWMHDPVGQAYWGSVGKLLDDQVARMKQGIRARFPDDAAAAGMTDALFQIGQDRLLPRGGSTPGANNETLSAWATRLKNAWTTWQQAGQAHGLLTELAVQGFPMGAGTTGTSIFNHLGRRYTLDNLGNLIVTRPCANCQNRTDKTGAIPTPLIDGFTLDARDQFYACFCILFMQDVPSLTNAEGNTAKAILNQTVRRWRQGGAHYVGAAVVPQENSAKVCGWPASMKVGGSGLTVGLNGSRFISPE
jgi:hypothetical protein